MAEKKYYWLKLHKDFFKRHDIKIIEAMPNGKDYVLFYLKLLVESVDHHGALRFSNTIPYNEQMLATITSTNVDVVRSAMKVFQELQMIEVLDNQTIYMNEVQKLVGCETKWAEKKRVQRLKNEDNVPLLSPACPPDVRQEKEIEIELDKEIDKEINKKRDKGDETPPSTPKKEKKQDAFEGYAFSPPMKAKLSQWLDYKKERREAYKPTGLQAFLSGVQNKLREHSESAVMALIDECMANNWKGIIWDKIRKEAAHGHQSSAGANQNQDPARGYDLSGVKKV